jgi:hypothetical protein
MARPVRPLAPAVVSLVDHGAHREDDDLLATREVPGRVATLRLATLRLAPVLPQPLPQPLPQAPLAQPPTMPPVAVDVTSASLTPASEGGELAALVRANVVAFVRHPRAPMFGAALLAVCVLAGAAGLLVGGTRAAAAGAVEARGPRVAVVMGAREEITEGPALASEKAGEEMDEPVLAETVAVRYAPARRPGFQRPRRSHR